MCGIAGWVDNERDLTNSTEAVAGMVRSMIHRGPDGHAVWTAPHAVLGQSRLAVIDLPGGAQPMVVRDDNGEPLAVISYNGETYNFRALRADLAQRGHRFRTNSDTEVVVRAFLEWGAAAVSRLTGMFAFAIWDVRERRLLLARDRLGIKPLYYARTPTGVVFASEMKALLGLPQVSATVTADGLREMFSMAHTPGETVYRGIRELPPGHLAVFNGEVFHQQAYWRLEAGEHLESQDATIDTVHRMLAEVVDRELVADVPLCTLLSGGLDSSSIAALAARSLRQQQARPSRTVTVTFAGYSDNFQPDLVRSTPDAPYARALADHVGAEHTDIELSSDQLADPATKLACLRAQDVPTPFGDMDSATYLAYQAVAEQAKVGLVGEAADEIFGGYAWIHIDGLVDEPNFPWVAFEQWHPGTSAGLGRKLFSPELLGKLDIPSYYADRYHDAVAEVPHPDLGAHDPLERRMREVCYLHLTRWLPRLLDRNDRLSMASGLEVRVPFCDHELVQYVYNVPWQYKTFDGREKSLLRAAVADHLPQQVLQRPKAPFPVTQEGAYTKALHAELRELLADPGAPVRDLLDLDAAAAAITEPDELATDWLCRMNIEMVIQVNNWLAGQQVRLVI